MPDNKFKEKAALPCVFDGEMKLGSSGICVRFLQIILDNFSGYFDNIFPTESNGIYGRKTESAVRNIQSACGLSPTGVTDIRSWNMIVSLHNILFSIDIS